MSDENKIPARVSITYSVDTNEVPDRVKILMNELANSFGGVAKLCRDAAAQVVENPVEGTKAMSEISLLIKKSNVRVEDCIDIMMGYLQILTAAAAELEEPPAPEEEPPAPEEGPTKKKPKKAKKKTAKKKASKKKED